VFYKLRDLVPGDLVTVDRADNTSSVFTVVDKVTDTRATFPDDLAYRVTGSPRHRFTGSSRPRPSIPALR